jgi:hypothetical protein
MAIKQSLSLGWRWLQAVHPMFWAFLALALLVATAGWQFLGVWLDRSLSESAVASQKLRVNTGAYQKLQQDLKTYRQIGS